MRWQGLMTSGISRASAALTPCFLNSGCWRWLAIVLLVLSVLAPYHQVVVGRAMPIPDDFFASDLADGEFPLRVEAGRIVREGEPPAWTPRVMTGMPLIVDPLSVALFTALPPALALGMLIALLHAAAGVGTYVLSRHLGASRSGAFLAGFAFAWSGFFICQMRHLSIIGTVAFFPWALYCLEQAAAGRNDGASEARRMPVRRRLLWLAAFAGFFGLQALAGFPQTAYISALVYAGLVAARTTWLFGLKERTPWRERLPSACALAGGFVAAVAVGALIGMVVLLPLKELGGFSDRHGGGTYAWVTQYKYYWRDVATFFVPYINGDISNHSYQWKGLFWEDYGYVGLITVLAALALGSVYLVHTALGRGRGERSGINRFAVAFWMSAGVVAFVMVLGAYTPLYRLALACLPGLSNYRFTTRFLFVVELALALLGGLGVTCLQSALSRCVPGGLRSAAPSLAGLLLVSVTVADLVWHNRRQNPLTDSKQWLAAPAVVSMIQRHSEGGRVYAPSAKQLHKEAFARASGWSGDLTPYYLQREFLQPNSNLLHGMPALNAYAAISPRWVVDLVGDHNREGLLDALKGQHAPPAYYDWLEASSVRWLLLSEPPALDRAERVGSTPSAAVYRLKGTLPRARFATRFRLVPSMSEIQALSLAGQLDVRKEAVLHDAEDLRTVEAAGAAASDEAGDVRIVEDRATQVALTTRSTHAGLLVLADTYYKGWTVTVDGQERPVLRVNVMQRGVVVPAGEHRVMFIFRPQAVWYGLMLTAAGLLLLAGSALGLALGCRSRRSAPCS